MNRSVKKLVLFLGVIAIYQSTASAHVKWFAESHDYIRPYQITDTPVIIAILGILLAIFIGVNLDKRLKVPSFIQKHIDILGDIAVSIASIGFGISFLFFSYIGFIFAPNLVSDGLWGIFLLIVQSVAGIMILTGFYERIGALSLVWLYILGIYTFGLYEMIDALEMLGFAFFLFILGRPRWHIRDISWLKERCSSVCDYALPLLRVGAGLNLMVLAFTEKLLVPSLTQEFLSNYNWNFFPTLGFVFMTDYWFAFLVGIAEFLFGLFLLLGLVTRLTIVVLSVFLFATLVLLGPIELIGHLPYFSIAIVLFVLGAGSRLKLIK